MAKRQGEKVVEQANIDELLAIMKELDDAGRAELVAAVSSELDDAKKKAIIAKIQQSAAIADESVKTWLVEALTGAYISGFKEVDRQVAKFGINTGFGRINVEILRELPELKVHLDAVNALLSDAYLDFGTGISGYIRGSEHILNDVIRRQIQSKIALGRLTGEGIRDIRKQIKNVLEDRGLEVLIDRGGNQWSLKRYSEMLSRTHVIRANTEATVNRITDLDIDIVEVSTHGTQDQLCLKYEGKIYSLSGKSKKYPQLPSHPPFHPNCKHVLLPRPDLDE